MMTSPFPGMDPWLEAAHIWPGLHIRLIDQSATILQPQLRERGYYIDAGERVWLTEPRRPVYPDNVIYEVRYKKPVEGSLAVAVAEPDEPIRVKQAEVEIREPYLEIFDASGHRLVTGIEFVSPTNKSDADGRKLYQRKQEELAEAGVNLVEVDLIRRGPHVLDIPKKIVTENQPGDYLINLVRHDGDLYEFYSFKLRDRLPRIRIPLKSGDADAVLDLQGVFERSYESGPYPERLDYSASPPPPELSPEDAAWADELLKSKGLRK